MKFDSPLIPGILVERYKRFLADVRLDNGDIITAHTPNTGSMLGCAEPGSRVWLRDTGNPSRKYPYAWELTTSTEGSLVGINTGLVNQLVSEAIDTEVVTELQGYDSIRTEVKYGMENSRIDLLLSAENKPDCYVEIKNVTAINRHGHAMFPDAVSSRATRHLRELVHVVEQGQRGVIFFCIQRADVSEFSPADDIDPEYGQMLRNAIEHGVEAVAYRAAVSSTHVTLNTSIPVVCS